MHPLTAHDIIRVWEWGEEQHPVDRALALLTAACPERTRQELVSLSVGQRDALLIGLQEVTFGPRLNCFAECPECCEALEYTVNTRDFPVDQAAEPRDREMLLKSDRYKVRFRMPDSLDLANAARCGDVTSARDLLIQRCIVQASKGKTDIVPDDLPEKVTKAMAEKMLEHDPFAEIQLDLQCSECGLCWTVILDIVSFLWSEVSVQAEYLLYEVRNLASAYGWREADILAMSARRRRFYMDAINRDPE